MRAAAFLPALVAFLPAAPAVAQVAAAPARPPAFAICAACHGVVAGAPSTVGPNLAGLGGRKAGSTGYAYSPAMKASGLVWDR